MQSPRKQAQLTLQLKMQQEHLLLQRKLIGQHHLRPNQQAGTALFMALLVVTLVTAISVVWYMQMRVSMRRTQQMLTSQQAYLYAQGVEDWAISALKIDETLPKALPQTPTLTGRGWIVGKIEEFKKEGEAPPVGTQSKQAMASIPEKDYLLRAEVKLGDQDLVLYSVLRRKNVDGKVTVLVVSQSRGES